MDNVLKHNNFAFGHIYSDVFQFHVLAIARSYSRIYSVGFEALIAVHMKSITFWDVPPYCLVEVQWCFERTHAELASFLLMIW
jgi:hypothetical protein